MRNSEVIAYLEAEKMPAEIVYYETADAQKQALIDGEVDMISSVSLSPVTNTRIVAQFAARPYYFVSTKGNTALIARMDGAMEKINQAEPKLQDTLYDTYFRNIDDTFLLSEAQKAALQAVGTFQVLCVDQDAPYVSQIDGQPAGMLISILDAFAENTGVTMEYTFCADRNEAKTLLEQQDFDLVVGAPMSSSTSAQLGLINSASVIDSVLAYVQNPTSRGNTGSGTIAVVEGLEDLFDLSAYDQVILCDNARECIQAVEKKQADLAAGSRSVMEYYIYDTGSTLVTSMIPGLTQNVSIAVSRDCDTEVLAALNNYIYSISEGDLATYLSDGNLHPDTRSVILFIRRHPVWATLLVGMVTALVALLLFLVWHRYAKQKAAMQRLHNSQLQEALQIAREANESKTTFLSNMSHDIRTPMNAVIGFSTLLAREPDNETKVKEYARKITAASNHLLGLINDILDISKIESGKMTLNQSVFSLEELVESINIVVRPMAAAKKQEFQVHMKDIQHELFVGDKVRTNQILINLLSNAVKYTPENGHISFQITDLGNSSTNFECLRFQIADDGYGITEEFQKIIFDPFTRAENSTTNKEVGTGLGLAITKNIVDLMGGTIDLKSQVNEGTTFTVELPLRIPLEEQDEHFWEKHGVTRMLLVDDDPEICKGIRIYMEGSGVNFDEVYSGEDAVDLVKKEYAAGREYNVIILDWQMPGMNGLDTAREIRKIVPIDTPILFLTSYDWSEIETEALEIDVDGFLAKPFSTVNLKEKLIEVETFRNTVSGPEIPLDLKGLHFLMAEDNQLNAEIMTEILKAEGASCDVAENGQQAVDMFTSAPPHTYDAVLMDVMMPVMNGYDATRKIRASGHPEAYTIPIVALTANAFVKDVQDALDAGMNAHIAKPINMDTLRNTLGSCIIR